jgi:hypothetical protein
MSSNINITNIDGLFPVAGQDNDSQGFRDNFTNIKNNFDAARAEIEDLQGKAILKTALTGSVLNNDFGDALVQRARIQDFSEVRADLGTVSGSVTLDHELGHYQTLQTSGDVTLAYTNWPATGTLGRVRLAVTVANTSHRVTLPASVTQGVVGLAGYESSVRRISYDRVGTYLLEFTTTDAGTNINVEDLSRARNVVPIRTISDIKGREGDVAGMMVLDISGSAIWFAVADYDGTADIWKKATIA